MWRLGLVLACVASTASASADPASLDDVLVPLVTKWEQRKLSDAQYEQQVKTALRKRPVAPLWALGFDLRRKSVGKGAVRVRDRDGVRVLAPDAVWTDQPGLQFPLPTACSYGCCRYETEKRTTKGLRVEKACFAKGELTDLDVTSRAPIVRASRQEDVATLKTEDAVKRWLAGSDRAPLALALAAYAEEEGKPLPPAAAIRAATTRPVEIAAWEAAAAFAKQPRADRPFVVSASDIRGKVTRTKRASWIDLTATQPVVFGNPAVCIGSCCRYADGTLTTARATKEALVSEACFDREQRLTRVTLAQSEPEPLSSWIVRRVREEAKASNWSPTLRPDACLAAAIRPDNRDAVLYCAQRSGRGDVWAYLNALVESTSPKQLYDDFDYDAYWVASAPDAKQRVVRRASLQALASVAKDGAVLWRTDYIGGTTKGGTLRSGAELRREFERKSDEHGMSGNHFYGTPSVVPTRCDGMCCDYELTMSTPCPVGGGPTSSILYRACFDATGAATDYFVGEDSEADLVMHHDAP